MGAFSTYIGHTLDQLADGRYVWSIAYENLNFDSAGVVALVTAETVNMMPDHLAIMRGLTIGVNAAAANLVLNQISGPWQRAHKEPIVIQFESCTCPTKVYIHRITPLDLHFRWPPLDASICELFLSAYGAADDVYIWAWGDSFPLKRTRSGGEFKALDPIPVTVKGVTGPYSYR